MLIFHVIPSLDASAGGPTTALIGMASAQARAGLDVSVLTTWRQGQSPDAIREFEQAGVKVTQVGPVSGALRRHPDMAHQIDRLVGEADVVHIHSVWEEPQHLAARAAIRKSKPYIITPHGMLDPWSLAQKKWKKKLYMAWRLRRNLNQASALHFTTEAERDACAGLGLKPQGVVIPLGISWNEFEALPPRDALRRQYPQIGNRSILVFLGRIHPGKGVEYLVPALAQTQTKPVLVVVGPDSNGFRATIESMVDQAGLKDRVFFTGMLKGPDRIVALAGADLFALPSDHENFGMSVVESLAARTPVIISNEVALSSEVIAGKVGSVVQRDPTSIAAAIDSWLSDESELAKARD
ncbi:MAG TPA: glycosyltransferase, partial [Tepidisphaeraceae bacterium]|nr:glycosyltransferase [Tepidisphaeraceae bacterium]